MYTPIDSFERQANALILLVHGTFAKDAPWTSDESFFSNELKKEIKESYDIGAFPWDGKNSHSSRIRAGEELSQGILECIKKGYKKIILIGHSHGGNVILYAIKNIKISKIKIEVITLSTPFINSSLKERNSNLNYLVFISILKPILYFAVSFIIIFMLYVYFIDKELISRKPSLIFRIIIYLAFWIPIITIYNSKKAKVKEKIWTQVKDKYQKISVVSNKEIRTLVTYFEGDKVKAWVMGWIKSSNLLISVYDKYRLLTEFTWKETQKYLIFIILLFFLLAISISAIGFKEKVEDMIIHIFSYTAIIIFLIFLFYCIFNVTLRIIMLLKESNFLILGYTSYKYRIFFKFDISHIPNHLNNCNVKSYKTKGYFAIKHSNIYNDKNVIKDIANWINEKTV